ncbi:MAG: AAA family ATPase [Bacteroidetes bacterium]|nr:AAA family ATPase [Bacteroidota bacterium]
MYISKVSLVNYKNFRNAFFEFNEGINTIIGENGSGKTNIFKAIRLILDDNMLRLSYKLDESDFNRDLGDWRGHWIIISLEFSDLSPEESIQALFVHGAANIEENNVDRATYNLFFRPKSDVRLKLSQLDLGDVDGLSKILDEISIDDYETYFTGKSTVDFNDEKVYKEIVGDFETVEFPFPDNSSKIGVKIPHQLSISKEISFTFIQALRDVVSDFHNVRTNPLLNLLKIKSEDIDEEDYKVISSTVRDLNNSIEQLPDVLDISKNIKETIKSTVGETYSPSSLTIKSSLSEEANKLLQSLRLFIGEPDEDYEGGIHELSLGGANLIYLTLKLLEFNYQKARETFANFLLIEEPEAHIHTHIQKTLFDKLDYGDTQIIYSTHSTQISEVSNLSNINVLSKQRNHAITFQPSKGLSKSKIEKLERYLDAIRTNLLFAKGIMLVEGDAEEILVPLLIKKVLGVSLDELGVSIINIRSTGFENVADIFHEKRIRRKCSIITDLDTSIIDYSENENDSKKLKKFKKKCENSEVKGVERKSRLDEFVKDNEWLDVFYAQHTFEVDFLLAGNDPEVCNILSEVYKDEPTIKIAEKELSSDDVGISGKRILTVANNIGKGWFAIILGKEITIETYIPDYIHKALIFAIPTLKKSIIADIIKYRIKENLLIDDTKDFENTSKTLELYINDEATLEDLILDLEKENEYDSSLNFLKAI